MKNSFLFTTLAVVFAICLVVANIVAGKLWAAPFNIVLTAGVFCFPIVYIIGDIVPEVYGLRKAQQVIALGFVANFLAVCFFWLTLVAPYPVFWTGQDAFNVVLGFTPRLLVASFLGYLVGTNVNAAVLVFVKKLTGPKLLWVRTISSTLFGEGVDSLIFITTAFWGILPPEAIWPMIFYQATFKVLYEAAVTPLTYWVVNYVKKLEGVDQYAS